MNHTEYKTMLGEEGEAAREVATAAIRKIEATGYKPSFLEAIAIAQLVRISGEEELVQILCDTARVSFSRTFPELHSRGIYLPVTDARWPLPQQVLIHVYPLTEME